MEKPSWYFRAWAWLVARALETLFAAILLGILAAVGVKLAAAGITLAEAAFVGLWTAAGVLLVVSQYQQIRKRARKKRLANRTSEEVATQILNWMHKFHYGVRSDAAPDGFEFKLVVDFTGGVPVTVLKKREIPWLSFATRITVEPAERAVLAQRSAIFVSDLVIQLVPLGIGYKIEAIGGDGGEIQSVWIEHSAHFGEITNDLDCLRAIRLTASAFLVVAAMIKRVAAIAQLNPPSAEGGNAR